MKKVSITEENEQKHFNEYAKKYDENYHYFDPFTKYKIIKKYNDLAKFIKKSYGNKPIKILEIGCGTGEYTKIIAKKFPKSKIVGLDISSAILEVAKNKCKNLTNATFVTKSAFETGFKESSFDMVIGFYVLHHIDISRFAKEANRILRPTGKMFFYEPNILNPIVYIIKSNKFIKNIVGDSPDEWAINPLTVGKDFKGFLPIKVVTSEFIIPFSFIPIGLMISLDKVTDMLKFVPLINLFGGSVQMYFQKK